MRCTRGAAGALVLMVTLALSGCSSQQETYCSTLESEQKTLQGLSAGADDPGTGALATTIDVFERLRADAPDDLVDEWDTYVTALQALEKALKDAGADESMFTDGEKPDGMSQDDYDRISAAAVELRSTRVVEAAAGLEQHAADVCKIDLDGSDLSP